MASGLGRSGPGHGQPDDARRRPSTCSVTSTRVRACVAGLSDEPGERAVALGSTGVVATHVH